MDKNEEKKKPATWDGNETECFLATIKELQVITLMDGKKFRISEIFKKVEETFKKKGYNRTHTQLLDKFKAMKKRFKTTVGALSVSGAGTKDKEKNCPFFEELNEIFGHRPIVNQSGVDSTILQPSWTLEPSAETSDYCASDTETSVSKKYDEPQTKQFIEHTSSRSTPSPLTSIGHKRALSSDTLYSPLTPSPISKFSFSEDSRDTSTPPFNELDESNELCTVSSKKRKICETPTSLSRESPRSGLKNIMHTFTKEIIESQEKLLTKTIEEQRKLDQEMFNQYNNIFLQQTQMLLTGLQNLSVPFPQNYSSFQPFSAMPPIRPMFAETLLHQSYPQQIVPCQNDRNTAPKSDQTRKAISTITTSSNSIQSKNEQPLAENSFAVLHTPIMSQSKTPFCPMFEEDEDVIYEDVEFLDDAKND